MRALRENIVLYDLMTPLDQKTLNHIIFHREMHTIGQNVF